MQIFLTAKSRDGQNFANPRVIAVNDANIEVSPGSDGWTRVVEYNEAGVRLHTHIVYETPAQIQAQSLVADNQATNLLAKNYVNLSVDAAGATAAAAADITKYLTEIDTATAATTDGIQLDAATVNKVRVVVNVTAVPLDVWPQTGENHKGLADDALKVQAALSRKHYVCLTAGEWTLADDYTG
jgi:hypothetical protein